MLASPSPLLLLKALGIVPDKGTPQEIKHASSALGLGSPNTGTPLYASSKNTYNLHWGSSYPLL